MNAPQVKKSMMTTICFETEPWESVYMLFMLPGLILWIIGAIWCFRKNNVHGSVLIQILGAVEITIGGLIGFIFSMRPVASVTINMEGGFSPLVAANDFVDNTVIPLIGLITHFVLLGITLKLAIRAKRNRRLSLQVDNSL